MKTTSCPVTIDFLIRKGVINSDTGKHSLRLYTSNCKLVNDIFIFFDIPLTSILPIYRAKFTGVVGVIAHSTASNI